MDESTAPFREDTFVETGAGIDEENTSTDEEDTESNEAATYTLKDANDTRRLHHTINSTSNPTKKMRIPSGDNRNLDDQSKHKDNSFLQTSGIQTSISNSEMKRRQHYMGNWIHLGKYHETMFV
jgi:hypothetical protein